MNNENFAGIMGTVKQAEITNGVCGYDTENRYAVLRVYSVVYVLHAGLYIRAD